MRFQLTNNNTGKTAVISLDCKYLTKDVCIGYAVHNFGNAHNLTFDSGINECDVVNGKVKERRRYHLSSLKNGCDGDCDRVKLVRKFDGVSNQCAYLCVSCAKKFGYDYDKDGYNVRFSDAPPASVIGEI